MAIEREREVLLEYLRERGLRMTQERAAVFEEIFGQHGHVDAADLHAALEARGADVSRATVYRNLQLLVDCGLVRKQRLDRRRYLYEHVHAGQRHDHLVCRECGRVVEFVSPGIAALQREICRAHGFRPGESALQISGLCEECGAGEEAPEAASTAGSG